MIVLGRRTADLDEFMEKLEATGAFENVLPRQQNLNDDGLTQVTIEAVICSRGAAGRHASSAGPAREGGRGWRGRRPMTLFRRVLAEKRGLIYPLIGAVLSQRRRCSSPWSIRCR